MKMIPYILFCVPWVAFSFLGVCGSDIFEHNVSTCGSTLRCGGDVSIANRVRGEASCQVHATSIKMVRFILLFHASHVFSYFSYLSRCCPAWLCPGASCLALPLLGYSLTDLLYVLQELRVLMLLCCRGLIHDEA